jgi:hypothetical protein
MATSREDVLKALKQVPAVVCEYGKVGPRRGSGTLLRMRVYTTRHVLQAHQGHFECVRAQPIVHYTFIPLIIVLGMTMTEPRPTLAQLLGPM